MDKSRRTLFLDGLVTGYRNKRQVHVVSGPLTASLFSGELTCLLGANGSGKSTLLRTLSAFLPSIGGDVLLEGKSLRSYARKELSHMLGVVLTERIEIQDLSVRNLVAMGRMPYTGFWGYLTDADRKAVDVALEQVGMLHMVGRSIHTLSDGEMQKVLIAKALAQETPFIFLDEPTAFLDYPSKADLFLLLRNLAYKYQKTVFLSTHDVELALQMADRLWILDRAHGLYTGIPEDLALGGVLEGLFTGGRLGFYAEGMSYRVEMPAEHRSHVCISGTDCLAKVLLGRALRRKGFIVTDSADSATLQVEVMSRDVGMYRLLKNNENLFVASSIDTLLSQIMGI